jgi:hypothetical protein
MDFSTEPSNVSSHRSYVWAICRGFISVVKIHNVDLNGAGTFAAILATNETCPVFTSPDREGD